MEKEYREIFEKLIEDFEYNENQFKKDEDIYEAYGFIRDSVKEFISNTLEVGEK